MHAVRTRVSGMRQAVVWARNGSILAILAFSMPTQVAAQEVGRIRLGSVGLTPTIAVTNMGIDGNVDNTAEHPQQDLTAMFTPSMRTGVMLGPSRLTLNNSNITYAI